MGLFLTFVMIVNFGVGFFVASRLGLGPRSLADTFRALGRIPPVPPESGEAESGDA